MVPRFILILFVTTAFSFLPNPVSAQTQIVETIVEYSFGNEITFQADLSSEVEPELAVIFFQAQNDTHTEVKAIDFQQTDEGLYKLEYTHRLEDYRIRAFTIITYHYEILLAGGEVYKSEDYTFYYSDNRFDWQELVEETEEISFNVYWYDGDINYAQNILDMAQEGAAGIQNLLPISLPQMVKIYAYHDGRVMQDVFGPFSETWIAGHADPDLGVILVALPHGPDQRQHMEQRIPHEMMHILLYQNTGQGYTNLPTWLNEGLASMAELHPNPDYKIVLEHAVKNDILIPMADLCNHFPRDASSAFLSYAQADSFTRYLYNRFGTLGLQELVSTYSDGGDCEQGLESALGIEFDQLERKWQNQALNETGMQSIFKNMLPWLFLLGAVLCAPIILTVFQLLSKSTRQTTTGSEKSL